MKDVKLFQSAQIRSIWNDEAGEWFFSVVDVVGALTDSADKSAYWRKLKQRMKAEGNETVTNCHRLKLLAEDGKMRLTDTANTEGILRIIQSIPSPKAEPFKQWLAQLGANLFRITQAEDKLRRENISSKEAANKVHYEVGRTVRKTIEELGGTMPEKLPTPSESIKQLDKPKK